MQKIVNLQMFKMLYLWMQNAVLSGKNLKKNCNIFIDKTGRANGRGAYICNNPDCLEKAIKTKCIERSFETNIEEEIYNELRKEITDNK